MKRNDNEMYLFYWPCKKNIVVIKILSHYGNKIIIYWN